MSDRSKYEPGTPSWVELGSPDVEASKRFYGELLGWTAQEAGPAEETGGYVLFTLRGKNVAGLMSLMSEDQPPAWTTYVSVDDADKTTAVVKEAGGTVVVEPMEVMDAGRMAVFIDPTGAACGVWQPKEHIGAQLVNEPGAMCWNELDTRDPEKAKTFYKSVFGWDADSQQMGDNEYTIWMLGDDGVGGMMPMPDMVPAEVPSYWAVSFAVDDCDASVAKVESLGGSQLVPAMDMEGVGRFSVVADPHGAAFSVIKLTQNA